MRTISASDGRCKEFAASELVAIGQRLEEMEKPKAAERQKASQSKTGEKAAAQGGAKLAPPCEKSKTRDKVAEALGVSGETYRKMKEVVEADGDRPDATP